MRSPRPVYFSDIVFHDSLFCPHRHYSPSPFFVFPLHRLTHSISGQYIDIPYRYSISVDRYKLLNNHSIVRPPSGLAPAICRERVRTNQKWDVIMFFWIFDLEGDLHPRIETFAPCALKESLSFEYDFV